MEEFVQILNQARSVFRKALRYAAVITAVILALP